MIRQAIALALLLSASSACAALTTDSVEQDLAVAERSFYDLEASSLEGEPVALDEFRGQVSLVVNTASQCGYTPQYEALQALQEEYGERGFSVLAFPSGDFGGQEFDTPGEIREFCDSRYGVGFPLFAKSRVKEGEGQSPVFAFLGQATGSLPGWNFGKYLVDREGRVLGFYATPVDPAGEELRGAIEQALAGES